MPEPVFRRVLVPVELGTADKQAIADGDAFKTPDGQWIEIGGAAQEALRLAARLVGGGEVLLVHATPDLQKTAVYGGPEGVWLPHPDVSQLNEVARKSSEAVLRHLARSFFPGAAVTHHVAPGAALRVIKDASTQFSPDVIVLAASGRGRVRRAFIGSTADKVIRQANVPVLVVPTGMVVPALQPEAATTA